MMMLTCRWFFPAPPRIKRVLNPEFLQSPYDITEREEEQLTDFGSGTGPEDLIFQAGELVRLKYAFSGSPKPDAIVFLNGEVVEEPDRVIVEVALRCFALIFYFQLRFSFWKFWRNLFLVRGSCVDGENSVSTTVRSRGVDDQAR